MWNSNKKFIVDLVYALFHCKSDQRHQTIVWNIKVFVCIKDLKKANQISEIHIYIFKLLLCIYEKFFQTWKIQKMHFLRWFRLFFVYTSHCIHIQTKIWAGKSILYWLHALLYFWWYHEAIKYSIGIQMQSQAHCKLYYFIFRQIKSCTLCTYWTFYLPQLLHTLHFNSHFVYCLPWYCI